MNFKPRDYQETISTQGSKILNRYKILALVMEVRTGKTITSLLIADKVGANSVLFITKKKVIQSNTITDDYNLVNPNFTLTQINYESVHKIDGKKYDLIIVDESHSLGAYPKKSIRTQRIKDIVQDKKVMLLSGTITPESYSQIYHQFWISEYTPFEEKNFYKWAKNYVNVTKKKINGYDVNNYSNANVNLITQKISKYIISFTQAQAGFKSKVNEHILTVPMKPITYKLIKKIEKDLVFTSRYLKGGGSDDDD